MTYDWQAGLAFFVILVVMTKVGKWLTFKVPALEQTRLDNKVEDRKKRAREKYPPVMKATQRAGLGTNLVFILAVAPWFVTLEPQSIWTILLHTVCILMFYDFFYYLTHRFLFHGEGYFRRMHAVHHQARNPTYIDSHYVHPLETFIGVFLFVTTIPVVSLLFGTPFHAVTVALTYVIFTQLNQVNHCHIDLPYFPFKTLSWISAKHAIHHENMHKGNYATITLLYDKMFGTLD
jgi:sterol desaturase/sphingolipid hydroxylase (fatty acid hydroxylase superfamily)